MKMSASATSRSSAARSSAVLVLSVMLLVAVIGLEMRRIELALEGAERIAALGMLDLDHLRAEIGEQHSGGRAGDERPHLEHSDVAENLRHLRLFSAAFRGAAPNARDCATMPGLSL